MSRRLRPPSCRARWPHGTRICCQLRAVTGPHHFCRSERPANSGDKHISCIKTRGARLSHKIRLRCVPIFLLLQLLLFRSVLRMVSTSCNLWQKALHRPGACRLEYEPLVDILHEFDARPAISRAARGFAIGFRHGPSPNPKINTPDAPDQDLGGMGPRSCLELPDSSVRAFRVCLGFLRL
jgi:hypothetical protein